MSSLEVPEPEGAAAGPVSPVEEREWSRPWMGPFLIALARMPNISAAARLVGVTRQAAQYHARTNPEFREAWRQAVDVGVDLLEQIAHRRATQGEERVTTTVVVKRGVNEAGAMAMIEETTTTLTTTYVSDRILEILLKAHRPTVYRERADLRLVDPLMPEAEGAAEPEVFRQPSSIRLRELAAIARELEPEVVEDAEFTEDDGQEGVPEGTAASVPVSPSPAEPAPPPAVVEAEKPAEAPVPPKEPEVWVGGRGDGFTS